jgi:hypothetical protein
MKHEAHTLSSRKKILSVYLKGHLNSHFESINHAAGLPLWLAGRWACVVPHLAQFPRALSPRSGPTPQDVVRERERSPADRPHAHTLK